MNESKGQAKRVGVINALINVVLLVAAAGLGIVAFFSMMEILLTVAAQVIVRGVESEVRGRYALVMVRNLWLIIGGAGLVGLEIYFMDYFFKHWRKLRTRRLFLRVVAIEVVIIGLQVVFAA